MMLSFDSASGGPFARGTQATNRLTAITPRNTFKKSFTSNPNDMADTINLNTASTKELTQIPGIAKNLAYRIVNHRNRHGYFTHWEELLAVKEFPAESLDRIKQRATIAPPDGILKEEFGPRRLKLGPAEKSAKRPKGYTKANRATRNSDRTKRSA
ncbi:MAG TPA: helix-hairpin-helix domain-containing protein [Terriglobales bacterium]